MAFLNADGLFHGDRLRACSNVAQLHFPRLFLASNGFGRFEMNYARIVGAAYSSFTPPPTEKDLESIFQEYSTRHLLYVYEGPSGIVWGQWDTKSEWLPRYKTGADRKSPEPPEPAFAQWKSDYRAEKKAFQKSDGNFARNLLPVVVDVVVDVVVEKQICASTKIADPLLSVDDPDFDPVGVSAGNTWNEAEPKQPTSAKVSKIPDISAELFPAFWGKYRQVRSKAKVTALKAFRQKIKTRPQFDRILSALEMQLPELLSREPAHRPYASTWLNGERWEDEPDETVKQNSGPAAPDYYREFSSEDLG